MDNLLQDLMLGFIDDNGISDFLREVKLAVTRHDQMLFDNEEKLAETSVEEVEKINLALKKLGELTKE